MLSYSDKRHARKHSPEPGLKFRAVRSCLRLEFDYRCVYCLARETEVGPSSDHGGFEIEHFKPMGRPEFYDLIDAYSNLLWACPACNRAKGPRWPSPEEEARGYRFVDPCAEALGDHLILEGEIVTAIQESKAGAYMIDAINLNSAAHRECRRARNTTERVIAKIDQSIEVYRKALGKVRKQAVRSQLKQRIAKAKETRDLLCPAKPWDSVNACRCKKARAAKGKAER